MQLRSSTTPADSDSSTKKSDSPQQVIMINRKG